MCLALRSGRSVCLNSAGPLLVNLIHKFLAEWACLATLVSALIKPPSWPPLHPPVFFPPSSRSRIFCQSTLRQTFLASAKTLQRAENQTSSCLARASTSKKVSHITPLPPTAQRDLHKSAVSETPNGSPLRIYSSSGPRIHIPGTYEKLRRGYGYIAHHRVLYTTRVRCPEQCPNTDLFETPLSTCYRIHKTAISKTKSLQYGWRSKHGKTAEIMSASQTEHKLGGGKHTNNWHSSTVGSRYACTGSGTGLAVSETRPLQAAWLRCRSIVRRHPTPPS
jgi:hypothetical protein